MDIIEINSLRLRTVLGFSAHEINLPQDVVISLRIGAEERLAGETDNPGDAFNYRTVCKAIISLVSGSRFFLVEKLAEEIARMIVVDFEAAYVAVSVHKPGALRHADSVGIHIERRSRDYERNLAYLSLGSNIAPESNLSDALQQLRRETTLLSISSVYRSDPQGFADQPPFLNMAVKIHTARTPVALKCAVIDKIEKSLGRMRDPNNKNAPRTIDIDISLWNDEVQVYGSKPWHIPDPDIVRFAHVAIPLADLAPDYLHPTDGRSLAQIAQGCDRSALEPIEIDFDSSQI